MEQSSITLITKMLAEESATSVDSVKGRILRSAATLFRDKGFRRTTLGDIAQTVDISVGDIFQYFPCKEAILCGVMRITILLTAAQINLALESEQRPSNKLIKMITCELEAIHGHNGIGFNFLMSEWEHLGKEYQAEILILRDMYEQLWQDVLEEARVAGIIRIDCFILRRLIYGATTYTATWFNVDGLVSLKQLSFQILRLVIGGEGQPVQPKKRKLTLV